MSRNAPAADMEALKGLLAREGHTLVVANHGEVRCFSRRGVADLYSLLLDDSDFLRGAAVADKVVGRAAAALMISGGVARVHTRVISRPALSLFEGQPVDVAYDVETAHVVNRRGDGWCPLELRCRDCGSPRECLEQIAGFMNENYK